MDFDLDEGQRLLRDSVDRLIAEEYDFEQRKRYAEEPSGFSLARWAQYAELGLLGLPFPETLGGIGGGAVETMIVMEAFGRGLVLEPYLATVILGGGALRLAGSAAQLQALIPELAAGKLRLAFADGEADAGWRLRARGREGRRPARRQRRPPRRLGAHRRRPERGDGDQPLPR